MHALERRQYEMLLRVRDFGNMHRHVFAASSSIAPRIFDAVGTAIDDLTAADTMKLSALASARADRKAAARKALRKLLRQVSQLARVLRAGGHAVPPFEPAASKSDLAVLTTARHFASDVAAADAEFSAHGLGPRVIAEAAARFEAAIQDRGTGRADHTAARVRIHVLLSSALLDVRRLDLLVENELADDDVIQTVWKQARRVDDPRRRRRGRGAAQSTTLRLVAPPVTEAA